MMSRRKSTAVADAKDASSGSQTNRMGWRPVEVVYNCVNIKGGLNNTLLSANSIQYTDGDTVHLFVELEKNALWFLKGVAGPGVKKGDLKYVDVLNEIKAAFAKAYGEDDTDEASAAVAGASAVADGSAVVDDDADPMDALASFVAHGGKPGNKPSAKKSRAIVLEVPMLKRPPCVGCATNGTKVIWVYRKALPANTSTKHFKGNMYLRVDCLEWLLSYAADEFRFQGIPREIEETPVKAKGNCSAVADLHLEWDFTEKAWDAEIVAGDCQGTTFRLICAGITNHQWTLLKHDALVAGYRSQARGFALKNAGKAIVLKWGQAIMEHRGDDFVNEWRIGEDEPPSPNQHDRLGIEYSAVAAGELESTPKKARRRFAADDWMEDTAVADVESMSDDDSKL